MTQQNFNPRSHSGLTGPLDPTVERAHLLARWDEEELTATVPKASPGPSWLIEELEDEPTCHNPGQV